VRYVSTRGEAPPLGFMDVTLAGLARDGGLYVPESWPRLPPETIAGFAGLPYAEVAVEVIRVEQPGPHEVPLHALHVVALRTELDGGSEHVSPPDRVTSFVIKRHHRMR